MTDADREAILAEIDELAGVPERQPKDISVNDLQRLWGIGKASVDSRMKKLIEQGAFETLLVYDPAIKRQRRVYRKVEPNG